MDAATADYPWVIVPEVTCTVWPVDTAVALIVMSVPLVPTVKPLTTVVPPLVRSSASAAVPVPVAVAESGVPARVRTPLAGVLNAPPAVPVVARQAPEPR